MSAWPHVTIVGGTTEAPDETAQGAWLDLVTRAGFSFLMAHVTYLRDGQVQHRTDRRGDAARRHDADQPARASGAAAADVDDDAGSVTRRGRGRSLPTLTAALS